jgi:hypothetical protein
VRLHQIHDILTTSIAEDWRLLYPPVFHHQLGVVQAGGPWSLEVYEHHYSATYRHDVNLTMAWGFEVDRDLTFPMWNGFPDPQISRLNLDIFWAGALINRILLVSVDGGRGTFVMPTLVGGQDTVTGSEVAVGDLLMSFRGFETSGEYVRRAGIAIVPGGLRE